MGGSYLIYWADGKSLTITVMAPAAEYKIVSPEAHPRLTKEKTVFNYNIVDFNCFKQQFHAIFSSIRKM